MLDQGELPRSDPEGLLLSSPPITTCPHLKRLGHGWILWAWLVRCLRTMLPAAKEQRGFLQPPLPCQHSKTTEETQDVNSTSWRVTMKGSPGKGSTTQIFLSERWGTNLTQKQAQHSTDVEKGAQPCNHCNFGVALHGSDAPRSLKKRCLLKWTLCLPWTFMYYLLICSNSILSPPEEGPKVAYKVIKYIKEFKTSKTFKEIILHAEHNRGGHCC